MESWQQLEEYYQDQPTRDIKGQVANQGNFKGKIHLFQLGFVKQYLKCIFVLINSTMNERESTDEDYKQN